MGKKRNGRVDFAIADLFDDASVMGVGGWRGRAGSGGGGGGYPKNYGLPNFQMADVVFGDARLGDLVKIGIGGPWLRLARRVGFDVFLEIWRAICEDEGTRHDGGRRMPKLREFRAYQRFQRNEYIRGLAAASVEPKEIRRLVEKNAGERLSIKVIQGVAQGRYDRDWSRPDESGDVGSDEAIHASAPG